MTAAATLAQLASSGALSADTSGNVGIGTTTPRAISGYTSLGIKGTSGALFDLYDNSNRLAAFGVDSAGANIGSITSIALSFTTNNTERMRLDSNGRLYLNTTAAVGALAAYQTIVGNANSLSLITLQDTGTTYGTGTQYITFANSTAAIAGSVQHNAAGTVNYATSSDFRLKENIVDSSNALSVVDAIKVRAFDWKEDNGHVDFGFIAQELHQHYPDAVCAGDNDAELTDPKGTWQVDYGKLTPLLLKALQELKAELDVCKAEIAALKGV
jgi:hypothetical protein